MESTARSAKQSSKQTAKRPAAKKATPKKATPKKATPKKATPKKATPKKTAAKRAATKKSVTKTAPSNSGSAKQAAAKKAPARKAAANKSPAKSPAKKSPAAKSTAKKSTAKAGAGKLAVRKGESRWTAAELGELRRDLEAEAEHLRGEIQNTEHDIADLIREGGDGAGNDQADVGATTLERDQEMTYANNARDMLVQVERALARIGDWSYGICESCGNPIGKGRLKAFPRATLCLSCKEREERR